MLVTVVVVNFNGRAYLRRCLDSLACQTVEHEVIVVDNDSSDGSTELVRSQYPNVRLILLRRNAGFAAANNIGAREAHGRYIAFLNNDTEVTANWLDCLLNGLKQNPNAGFAASRIVYLQDRSVVDSAGDVVTRSGGAFKRGHGKSAEEFSEPAEIFGACGAACLFQHDVFFEVGGFDENFFLVFEDVDLSYRAQLLGYQCQYVPDAVVAHAGSAAIGRVSRMAIYYGQRNIEWVYLKNTPTGLLVLTFPCHVVYLIASAIYHAAIGALGPFATGKWAALGGSLRVLRQRRVIQRSRRLSSVALWRRLDRGWIVRKIAEKRFDLDLAGKP
mgnify:CR=1 FL=1